MEDSDWFIVTEVALEDAAVAVKLIVSQSRGKQLRGLQARPRVVTDNLKHTKKITFSTS